MFHRLQRALENSVWVFTLALLLLSVWGVGREVSRLQSLVGAQAALGASFAQLERHALMMERSLLGLAHIEHPKVRYVGYDPDTLYHTLKGAHREAGMCIRAIEAFITQPMSQQVRTALLRLQAEWSQLDTVLGEYLARGQPETVSLTTLRAFTFEGQGTFGDALHDLQRAYQHELATQWQRALEAMLGSFVMHLICVGLLFGLLWRWWGAPAQWLRAALQQPDRAPFYAARFRDTAWGELYEQLRVQERRLREVEQFMRDIAMGRTPAPITPIDAADPLARSSQWLLRRLEQTRAQQEKAG